MNTTAFDVTMWRKRAGQYSSLGWVQDGSLLQPLAEVAAELSLGKGNTYLDIGVGSGSVLNLLKQVIPYALGIGFDISPEMLRSANGLAGSIFIANAYQIPLLTNSIQFATMRMVLHHLCDSERAISEMVRVLIPGSTGVIAEYIVPDAKTLKFEEKVFALKEPGRKLWTPRSLHSLVKMQPGLRIDKIALAVMPQYSVRDWMGKSGLPQEVQDGVLQCYLTAPPAVVDSMGITITDNNDALVDRPFSYIVFTKKMTHSQLGQIEQFAKKFHSDDPQHDWEHIIRVRVNALELAKHYPETNLEILQAACFLHDIGRSVKDEGHPEESIKLASPHLQEIGLTNDEIEAINHAIHCHDVKKIHEANSIEAKLLFDADKLEILSVFGFLRVVVFLMEERHMKISEAVNFLWGFSLNVYEKLLNTEEARMLIAQDMDLLRAMVEKYNSWDQRIKH